MGALDSKHSTTTNYRFLSGDGEMAKLTREKDWSDSAVGPIESWPQSLLTTLSIILNSKFPMFLWWGAKLTSFYNDAYRPSLGENGKHPHILGMPAKDAWPETWAIIEPLINQVLEGNGATWSEDQLLPIFRNGKIEDVYWTFSYSPVNDESGHIAGVLVTCSETTDKVLTYKKLEESNDQLHFAIEATELGSFDYNPHTNTVAANNRLKNWFGLQDTDDIILDNAIEAIAEDDRARVIAATQNALQFSSGGHYDIEYKIIHPATKKQTHVRAKGRAWFGEDKIAYRFNGTLQDVTKEVLSRIKIEDANKRFRDTVKQAPIGITILRGSDYVVEIANTAYLEIVDRKEADFVGKPLFESLPEVESTVRNLLDNVVQTGISFQGIEYPIPLNRHGEFDTYYFNFDYHPLREDNGVISGIIVTVTDVTASVSAKQFIAESEKQFRNMVMHSPIPMTILKGKDYIIEVANKTMFEDIWRKNEHDVLGKKILEVFPELKEQKYEELLDTVFTTGQIYRENESVAYVQGDDGMKEFYLDFEYAPLFETDNTISGIFITVTDVTEKVEARIKVENSEKEFRQLADSLPELIWTTNSKGEQNFASKKWLEFTGIDAVDAASFAQMIHPDDFNPLIAVWTDCLETGKTYKAQTRLKN